MLRQVIQELVSYKDYNRCVKLDNGIVDIIVTVSEGPRIIRFGFLGQRNELCDDAPMTVPVLNEEWRLMGGHRLLHCPEEYPRTYEPDNDSVRWEEIPNGVKVIYEVNKISNIKKEMEITLTPESAEVKVLHKLINNNAWPIKTAPWACTVMAAGGTAIVPFGPQPSHFKNGAAGARYMTFWPYTDTNDKRIGWKKKYVTVSWDAEVEANLKLGLSNRDGWGGYYNNGHLFVVKADYISNMEYPDNGNSFEVFTCDFMVEIETLAPYTILEPGEGATHTEYWNLLENVSPGSWDDGDIDRMVVKYI